MRRAIPYLLAACASMSCLAPAAWAANGFSWDVQPGPNGSLRVSTSGNTYIVVIDGNHGWVGTEQEYERQRIAGVLKAEGFRELKIKGQDGNTHQMVSGSLPFAAVGSTNLGDISTMIYFDARPDKQLRRPPKPAASEYVGAVWVQSDRTETQAKIIDRESGKTFSPHYCHGISGANMRTCEFIVPRDALSHQSALLFAGPKGQPAVIPRASLAQEHNKVLLEKYKPFMGSRFALEDEDAAALRSLHELDSSVATTLPPLPPGVSEIKPRAKGCKEGPLELTQAQYDSIAIGDSAEHVECVLGERPHTIWPYGTDYREYVWKMKSGGFALITMSATEPRTVTAKRRQDGVDIAIW